MSWYYKGKVVTQENMPDCFGFVYKITDTVTGKFYIGMKQISLKRKTKVTKKEKVSTGTRKKFKIVTKPSGWENYYGSSDLLKADIELYGKERFKREILRYCLTKKYLSFSEMEYQFKLDVLYLDTYNGHIKHYYKRDIDDRT